jgi:hypothetical protein
MKNLVLIALAMTFCLLAQVETSAAQTAKRATVRTQLILRNVGRGRIAISKGALRKTIDLSEDVTGCAYVSGQSRIRLNKRGCTATPVSFELVDSTTHNRNTYLVVLSTAMDNCNVCGRCGASEAYSLIWLELDPTLRVLNKKSTPIEDCVAFISLVSPIVEADETTKRESPALPFKGDTLIVEFERRLFEEDTEKQGYRFSRLEYNRKMPEKGFVVTTEVRAKSSQKDQ